MILAIDAGNSRVKWGWHDGKLLIGRVAGWIDAKDLSAEKPVPRWFPCIELDPRIVHPQFLEWTLFCDPLNQLGRCHFRA